jgi:hypothetical protein
MHLLASLMFFLNAMFPLVVSSPLVALSSGRFRGLTVNGTDRWLGIPYARPPLGPLRFKSPLPISQLSRGIQDAFQLSHACPQPPTAVPISEDCLYLNVRHGTTDPGLCIHIRSMQVWRPRQTLATAKLSVLVWIHVRAFWIGTLAIG